MPEGNGLIGAGKFLKCVALKCFSPCEIGLFGLSDVMAERGETGLRGVRRPIWIGVALALVLTVSLLLSFSMLRSSRLGATRSKVPLSAGNLETVPARRFEFEQMQFRPGVRAGFDSTFTGMTAFSFGSPEELMRRRDADEAIPELIEALRHPSSAVRGAAAVALGRYRHLALDAVPILKELQHDDPDEAVRRRAGDALYNIRLYDFGFGEMHVK